MKIRLTTLARSDVRSRAVYLFEQSPDAAVAFLSELDSALAFLGAHPDAGRVVTVRGLRRPVRQWPLPPLILYFAVRDDTLVVYRLRHGARRPITR